MWTIIKFDRKNLEFLKKDFKKKLGSDVTIYSPKLLIQKYKKNKLVDKELNLLGDYLFCFHNRFKYNETLNLLKFTRGLKYFLGGFSQSQEEIEKFVKKCKESENEKGYLSQSFFHIRKNSDYKFTSGPFSEKIFKIIDLQKNKINILLGNIKTTIKNKEYSFKPL
tara:strand:- start:713 stop:1210 length:498 start_codon:yes stop_codon:yes gene_type:complete